MPIVSLTPDTAALTLTAVGEYPVTVARLWQAWTDARQIERFWGPPQWPATFMEHDVRVGGGSRYYMTGPEGQTSHGFWTFKAVEPGRTFEAVDGFCNPEGSPIPEMPGTILRVSFEATEAGARFTAVSTFADLESMEKLIAMGAVEGYRSALSQMDALLADLRDWSKSFHAEHEVLSDTRIVVRRVVRGRLTQVWRAHTEAALLQKWMLGPPGWTMPVCQVTPEVGGTIRYEWENAADESRFGFMGVIQALEPPRRMLSTEQMIGADGPANTNEIVLTPQPGDRTLIEVFITYPSIELRDIVLGQGMVTGMEASYSRLDTLFD
jgi:uncharacterized protein YndB with AHSA1/START domain